MEDIEAMEAFRGEVEPPKMGTGFALMHHVEIGTLLTGIPAISAMSPDQRTLVPQEISREHATMERGDTEAEVETEVAMVEAGVEVAMVGTEVGVIQRRQ